ncbi:hypothetical protein A3H10_01590 [Candidatus Uhrbacteria bacterium RIFCSPLOWO2_12_FULL_46_10]|nr:MAG: hypothetical protein A3H10_01590 [Candidatus Uhrbacteria bacterium RIFCSPLOWO2_12_FULL_46_10]
MSCQNLAETFWFVLKIAPIAFGVGCIFELIIALVGEHQRRKYYIDLAIITLYWPDNWGPVVRVIRASQTREFQRVILELYKRRRTYVGWLRIDGLSMVTVRKMTKTKDFVQAYNARDENTFPGIQFYGGVKPEEWKHLPEESIWQTKH